MKTLFEKAIRKDELGDGQMMTVIIAGRQIAIAHVGDGFYAVDDVCSHANCSLGTDGLLNGKTIMCGCHGATFDAESGKALTLPATISLRSYKTKVENGWIYIERG